MGDIGASRIVAPALAIAAGGGGGGAAPVLAAIGTVATATGNVSVPYPSGIAAGDLLVLGVCHRHTSITLPAGWSSATGGAGSIVSGSGLSLLAAVLVAGGSESGTLAVTVSSGTDTTTGQMFRYTGVSATTPQDVTAGSGTTTTTSLSVPAVTTATDNAVDIVVTGSRISGDTTGPGGYVERVDNSGASPTLTLYDHTQTPAGSTGSLAFTVPSTVSASIGVHAALRPA